MYVLYQRMNRRGFERYRHKKSRISHYLIDNGHFARASVSILLVHCEKMLWRVSSAFLTKFVGIEIAPRTTPLKIISHTVYNDTHTHARARNATNLKAKDQEKSHHHNPVSLCFISIVEDIATARHGPVFLLHSSNVHNASVLVRSGRSPPLIVECVTW